MNSFEQTTALQTIEDVDLGLVTGGFDFGQAVQAGNAGAGPGREAGQTLGSGFDAAYRLVRGQDTKIGSTVGGPLGAAVGWGGGFAQNALHQLWSPRK
jgi:hypothetical protein